MDCTLVFLIHRFFFFFFGERGVRPAGRRAAGVCAVRRGGGARRPARGPVPRHEAPVGRPRRPTLLHPLAGVPAQRLGRLVSKAPRLDGSKGMIMVPPRRNARGITDPLRPCVHRKGLMCASQKL